MPLDEENNDLRDEGSPRKKKRDQIDPFALARQDSGKPGDYNKIAKVFGSESYEKVVEVPVFGMRGTAQGAYPDASFPEPRSKKLTEAEARSLFVRQVVDLHGHVGELLRLMREGRIEHTPENVKKAVDAQKSLSETLLRLMDTSNKHGFSGSATESYAITVVQQVCGIIDAGFSKARQNELMGKKFPVIDLPSVSEPDKEAAKLLEEAPKLLQENISPEAFLEKQGE